MRRAVEEIRVTTLAELYGKGWSSQHKERRDSLFYGTFGLSKASRQ